MAVVLFGPTVVGIRGSIGGVTFSENATSTYAKSWARPRRSARPDQSVERGLLVDASILWQALDPADKADWNWFAGHPNELDYDPWSNQRFLSGFQWFMRAQRRRQSVSLPLPGPVPSGAAEVAVTGLTVSAISGTPPTAGCTYDDDQFLAGQALILYMALSPRPGQADAFVGWKLLHAEIAPPNGGIDISAEFEAAFGSVQGGWRAYAMAFKQADAGNRSVIAQADCLVT